MMYLAVGLLKSSEVRMDEISKMLADIFMHPLHVCCCRVNASALLARRNKAERSETNDIIVKRD